MRYPCLARVIINPGDEGSESTRSGTESAVRDTVVFRRISVTFTNLVRFFSPDMKCIPVCDAVLPASSIPSVPKYLFATGHLAGKVVPEYASCMALPSAHAYICRRRRSRSRGAADIADVLHLNPSRSVFVCRMLGCERD